jgi:TRAP-type C4-dicarboxylate transport system substrate-binding protein
MAAVIGGSLFASGQGETSGAEKVYTIKIGHEFTTESPRHKGLEAFKSYVRGEVGRSSQGRTVSGGSPRQRGGNAGIMKMGNLEAFVGGPFDAETEKLNLILMPFFFNDRMRCARRP